MTSLGDRRVRAILGPTNTGKTHFAIERMLGHESGVIGFPLRLLARENYDRIRRIKGGNQVALVTGEEKIVPPGARYFCCTVESMPLERPFAFLAVDEIQLAADPERGHIFTQRLLSARGLHETLFLGSDTLKPILSALVPDAEFISRPRFSTLGYTGTRKLTRLPPRSAVIVFSAAELYAVAELMRRQRGGTAVVLGALSPRTRNAQVEMFESGEVDYLVATDAIGMGLNLNLEHVAFARLSKFDGRAPRRLTAAEIGQIAGRAGRHMSDGTFGTTGGVGGLDPDIVEAVENHRFDPADHVYWRSRDLDFRDPDALVKSLDRFPLRPEFVRVREADDAIALKALVQDPQVRERASNPGAVQLLWETCQVPDFHKILSDHHVRLLKQLYLFLSDGEQRIPEDWIAGQVKRLDHVDGDIEQLVAQIAFIRTWTYITHRGDWLENTAYWQQQTRGVEDRLSDALHERLTQRFVDKRTAALVRHMRGGARLAGAVRQSGEVLVEGELVGRLEGFRFLLDSAVQGEDARPVLAAARKSLAPEISQRVRQLEEEADGAFHLEKDHIYWRDAAVARLAAGDHPLNPRIVPLTSDLLDGRSRERVRLRLARWLDGHLQACLRPLFKARNAEIQGPARGILYQLCEGLGTLPRTDAAQQIATLDRGERRRLRRLGLTFGMRTVHLEGLLKPRAIELRAWLWAVHRGRPVPELPRQAPHVLRLGERLPEAFYHAAGYHRLTLGGKGDFAVRVDALEALSRKLFSLVEEERLPEGTLASLLPEARERERAAVLEELGFRSTADGPHERLEKLKSARRKRRARPKQQRKTASPFAVLKNLETK